MIEDISIDLLVTVTVADSDCVLLYNNFCMLHGLQYLDTSLEWFHSRKHFQRVLVH